MLQCSIVIYLLCLRVVFPDTDIAFFSGGSSD
jgi:hypothetical protein